MPSTTNHNALILEVVYEAFKNGFAFKSFVHKYMENWIYSYMHMHMG